MSLSATLDGRPSRLSMPFQRLECPLGHLTGQGRISLVVLELLCQSGITWCDAGCKECLTDNVVGSIVEILGRKRSSVNLGKDRAIRLDDNLLN